MGGRAVLCDGLEAVEIVYGLADPKVPSRVRYVGRTCNPQTRYAQHMKGTATRVAEWIGSLVSRGRYPVMVELERGRPQMPDKSGGASDAERRWITEMQRVGQADLNTVPKWWQEDDEWLKRLRSSSPDAVLRG